jgi:hypothetical protein
MADVSGLVGGATQYGLIFYAVVSLLLFAFLISKIKSFRSKTGNIVALAIAFGIGFLFLGPFLAMIINPFSPVPLIESTPVNLQIATEEGSIKVCAVDAMTGSPITSGKIYLLRGNADTSTFDAIKKGTLKAGTDYFVMTVDSNGCATFAGMSGSATGITYGVIYEPSSFSNSGYPLYVGRVIAYNALDTGLLKTQGSTLMIYKLSGAAVFDPTGTAKGSYTVNTLTFDLSARFGPTTASTAISNVYLYTNRSDTMTDLSIFIGGSEVSMVKLSTLDSSDPRLKNAPSGATYVSASPIIADPLVYDNKVDIRVKGTFTSGATLLLTFVKDANSEYADVSLGTFKVIVNTAGTPGWGS